MKSDSSRYGLVLFFVYLLFYGGFVAINAIAPESMERTLMSGLNTAVVFGFALIFGAVLLSAVYGLLCGDVGRGGDAGGGEQ
jgi:uncharacterized membrane protein (DUF485 family)